MEEAARLVFPSFQFGLHDPQTALRLVDLGVGGFCLYGGEVGQIKEFTGFLQERAAKPLLFCADYEDGLASHAAGGTALSSNMGLGASGSETWAYRKGFITGLESRAIGVRWVFAPVCDVAIDPANPIVNIRAFSDDPKAVTRLARAYLRGLKDQGVLGCVKHFPGHGRTVKDSHLDLPVVKATRGELDSADLPPFRELAAEAGSVMTAHLIVPALEKDKKVPYSLSADVNKTLRGELGFKGLVTTDALNMHAISDRFPELEAARRAVLGGADVLLVPADPERLVADLTQAIDGDALLRKACETSLGRLAAAQASLTVALPEADFSLVGCAAHGQDGLEMAQACLAWPREPQASLPGEIVYWEPEADSESEWQGAAFVFSLRKEGVKVTACDGKAIDKSATLVVGCFLSPRAYTGKITYDKATSTRLNKLLKIPARSLIVSFGSPYVFADFDAPGLCAFSRNDTAQAAAAAALVGKIPVSGLMPVSLSPRRAK
jgi:beta-glucosidase-like glycosyl hydrolase